MIDQHPFTGIMMLLFAVGYLCIIFEHLLHINKTTTAILTGVVLWILQFMDHQHPALVHIQFLYPHLSEISQIIFFIMGALTIVEIINSHRGFQVLSRWVHAKTKHRMLWGLGILTFFLSSVLDNLTTTIVMIAILRKLLHDQHDRQLIGGGIVIAANAGGAWTPIGDVTTTMLWIGGQVSSFSIIRHLFFPSMICFLASFALLSYQLKKGNLEYHASNEKPEPLATTVFILGVAALVGVPIFKLATGLPPFMGIFFGLSILWIVTDLFHHRYEERMHLRIPNVLSRIDLTSTLFFFGILLAIAALDQAGILKMVAHSLDQHVGAPSAVAVAIGLLSAVVDNVPLVAASMGMYSLESFQPNSDFWNLIAYCAGTGGSLLIIGSAAGVVYMGMERVSFLYYMRTISLPATVGYFGGVAAYLLAR